MLEPDITAVNIGTNEAPVRIKFFGWSPDRELNPQYADVQQYPDIEKMGIIEYHLRPGSTVDDPAWCAGTVTFDTPEVRRLVQEDRPLWTVEQWDPLTLSPSILCKNCGQHGYIQNGVWVPA